MYRNVLGQRKEKLESGQRNKNKKMLEKIRHVLLRGMLK